MSLTITGPILALIGLYYFVRWPRKLILLVTFFAPFSSTAILNVTGLGYKAGGLGLTPAMFYLWLYFATQFLLGHAFRPVIVSTGFRVQIALIGAFVAFLLLTTVGHAVEAPLTSFQLTQTIYVLLGFATAVTFAFDLARGDMIDRAIDVIKASAVFVACWGLLQFASYALHFPYPDFVFNNSQSDAADLFAQLGDGFLRIASVAVEPSFFASSMLHFVALGATVLIGEPRLRTRGWVVSVGFCTLMLLLCTSTTAYFGLAILAALLMLRFPITTALIGAPCLVVVGIVIAAVPKLSAILAAMTIDKGDSLSYLDRISGAAAALRTFLENPVFGGGWSAAPNFNSITATLGNVGILGAVLFVLAGLATLFELQSRQKTARSGPDWRFSIYAAGVQNALIVAFACSISTGIKYVVLDDVIFWGLGIAISSRLATGRVPGAETQLTPPVPAWRRPAPSRPLALARLTGRN